MNRMMLAGLTLSLAGATAALADNRSRTQGFVLSDGTIEAVPNFSEDQLYWCGAFEAVRGSASGTDRLYVLRGPGPSRAVPGRTGVVFGLTPPAGGARSAFSISVDVVGNNLSVTEAAQTCNERSASG